MITRPEAESSWNPREARLHATCQASRPVSRTSIVLGKVLGGTVLAFGQGLVFLLLSPLIGLSMTPAGWAGALGLMLVMSFALTALGFCIAWRMSSTQGFHAIMNLFLMPMWFLSGALFPPTGVTFCPLRWIMQANPLTYGLAGLRVGYALSHPSVADMLNRVRQPFNVNSIALAAALMAFSTAAAAAAAASAGEGGNGCVETAVLWRRTSGRSGS